jgi:hypothetical protein
MAPFLAQGKFCFMVCMARRSSFGVTERKILRLAGEKRYADVEKKSGNLKAMTGLGLSIQLAEIMWEVAVEYVRALFITNPIGAAVG